MRIEQPQRGELWWVDWSPGRGSEQLGRRPALIIQTNLANQNPSYSNTIVLTVSTKGHPVPFHIAIEPTRENGLSALSYIKCEQVMTIDKSRLESRIGKLTAAEMRRVEDALRITLALE
ncbi:MAG: type II toxin-antitoxin system PemK/MazF family toxin [Armatimonadota bacterium]